jgi:hypothetical protein
MRAYWLREEHGMAQNQDSIVQETIDSETIFVRALLNDGWRWDPPVSATVINWAVDATWTPLQVQSIIAMFGAWAAVANVTFNQVTDPADAEIVLHQTIGADIGGFGGYSGTTSEAGAPATAGDVVTFDAVTIAEHGQVHTYLGTDGFLISGQDNTFIVNPDTTDTANPLLISAEGFELMLHEVGHALGLKHPHDGGAVGSADVFPGVTALSPTGSNGLNQSLYTLMSYNHWQDADAAAEIDVPVMATPMAFDIAAIQFLYGANTTIRSGDDIYVLSDPGSDWTAEAIWDTDGVDQIVYNGNANAYIDLRSATLDDSALGGGVLSYTFSLDASLDKIIGYGFTIAGDYTNALADEQGVTGVIIENAAGGSGDDVFVGNSFGNEWWGNAGDDTADGAGGVDVAIFSGARADYKTSLLGTFVEVMDMRPSNADGTNLFSNFELFEFSNGVYTLEEVLNQPPEAVNDSNGVAKNTTLVVGAATGVLANDVDDYDDIVVTSVGGSLANVGQPLQGSYGTLTLNADGSYQYVPNKGGLPSKIVAQDVFSYAITDDVGGIDTATLSIVLFNPGASYAGGGSISGGNGPDVLDGSFGNAILNGGNGPDVLIAGDGASLTGGKGPDIFLFRPEFGVNVITDFTVNQDALQFDKSIFSSSADLFLHTSNVAGGVIIDDTEGNQVTLLGVTLAQMQANASDFYFV